MICFNNKKPESIENERCCFFDFVVNTSARYLNQKSINRGPMRFLSQTSWVEIQVAHSTANTSANKETQLK